MTNQLAGTAIHEVGHAVVGHALGFKVAKRGITIVPSPTGADGSLRHYTGKKHYGANTPTNDHHLMVMFAGVIAQLLYKVSPEDYQSTVDEILLGGGSDFCSMIFVLQEMLGMNPEDKLYQARKYTNPTWCQDTGAEALAGWEWFGVQVIAALNNMELETPIIVIECDTPEFRILHAAAHKAWVILNKEHSLLYKVRAELLQRKKMSGAELRALLNA